MANVSYIAGAGFVTAASAARRLGRHEHEHRPPFGGIQSHPTSPSRSSATAIGTGMLTVPAEGVLRVVVLRARSQEQGHGPNHQGRLTRRVSPLTRRPGWGRRFDRWPRSHP